MKGEPEIVSYDRRSSAVIKIDNSDELSQPTSSIEEKLKQRKQEQVGSSQPTDFRGALKHREEDQKEGKDDAKAASDDAPAFGAELKKALHEEIESPVEQERNWPVSTVTETADYIPISPAASVETEEIVVIEDEEIVEDEYIEEVITEEGTSEYEEMSLKHEDNVVLESEPFDARKEENVETEGGQFSFRHENNSVDKNEPIGDGDLQREQKPVAVQKKGHKDSFEDKKKTRTQKDPPTALYHSDESELDEESQQQRKNTSQTGKNRSEMIAKEDKTFHIIVCFLLFLMISGGVAVALVFVLNNEEMAPGEGETTYLDPLQTGNCDFTGLVQPHIIDQCSCNGKISIISDDIRARYEIHLADFIPTVYQSYEESISSCSVRNQALVWLSSGNDYQFAYEERRQRFGLSALFIGLSGEKWNDREHWLSTRGSCVWFGVGCNNDDAVKRLSLEKNNVSGGVSVRRSSLMICCPLL